jgi:hypothetical protein
MLKIDRSATRQLLRRQVYGRDSQALAVVANSICSVIVAFESISVQNFNSHKYVYDPKFKISSDFVQHSSPTANISNQWSRRKE